MSTGELLSVHPSELKFPFELRKQSSCTLQLTNKTDDYVAFKVKTTNPKKYCVRPNSGIISPGSSSSFTVTMQGSKEAPPNMQCKDKFLLQSVIAPLGATNKEISSELFIKEDGKVIEEFRLRVVYVLANPPSPVPEGSEEGSSPRADHVEGLNQNATSLDGEWAMVSRLTDEKASAIEQNQKLRKELELLRKETSKSNIGSSYILLVVVIGLLGFLVSYLIN
ncbi:vesicle-associated protein 1-3-like isoform X2 [Apium graveolens]|uniref:vesicle-associated protein 1-3-like isoform X2 n=1 Tax=Apium graveolens TaxID=4045 RepID=UPI003D7AF44C